MPASFVYPFDKKLICFDGLQNSNKAVKIFFLRSLPILEESGSKHGEAINKIDSLEEVAKWKATAKTVWQVDCPMVANAIISFVEAMKLNHQLLSKVDNVFAKLISTRLDDDEIFGFYKYVLKENDDLASKVECSTKERAC